MLATIEGNRDRAKEIVGTGFRAFRAMVANVRIHAIVLSWHGTINGMTTPLPDGYGPNSRLKEGPEPKYVQLAAVLEARIERGDYPEDTRLPSVAALQNEFGVSRGTAQRAVTVLAEHGRVRVSNGKGAWPVNS